MQLFPKWLYHATQPARVFNDVDEHDDAVADGWVDTPAKLPAVAGAEEDSGVDKSELITQAKLLGIDAKGTWGVKKLQDAIAAELDKE